MGFGTSYGAVPWGAGPVAPVVDDGDDATSPEDGFVANEGGDIVTVASLAAVPNGTYRIHVGPLGTTADPVLYSGVSGNADRIDVRGGRFYGISPPLPIGGPYAFLLVNLATSATYTTPPLLSVIPHAMRSSIFSLRKLLPRKWRVGSTAFNVREEFPQT
jgi:hypothetical protein